MDSRKLFTWRLDFVIHMVRQLNDSFPVAGGEKIITTACISYNHYNMETTHQLRQRKLGKSLESIFHSGEL